MNGMKHLVWIPVALLAGLVVGGWAPRMELNKARAEIERLKSQGGGREGGGQATLGAITGMIRIPENAPDTGTNGPARPAHGGARPGRAHRPADGASTNAEPDGATNAPAGRPPETQDLKARIEAGMEAWRIRSDAARNAFVANAQLDSAATAQFDVLMAAMNVRLKSGLEQFAGRIQAGEKVTPENGVKVLNELSGALVTTYSEMDRTLPPNWRAAGGQSFDLVDFVDPSVATPLINVQDKLQRTGGRRGPPWARRDMGPPGGVERP